jgi:hypothetical protein
MQPSQTLSSKKLSQLVKPRLKSTPQWLSCEFDL